MQREEVNEFLEDVEHNGYNFSDGIGKITTELAMEVAARLPLVSKDEPPSAYQIRYAGFKGVVAVWPAEHNDEVQLFLRPSMRKFESTHCVGSYLMDKVPARIPKPPNHNTAHLLGCLGRSVLANAGENDT